MNWASTGNQMMKQLYAVLRLTAVWWLFNLPYLLLGVALLGVDTVGTVHTIVITMIIFMPFLVIPATVALLGIARKQLKWPEQDFPLLSSFWKIYKREYKKSVLLGGGHSILLLMFFSALRYYATIGSSLVNVFYVLLFLLPFYFLYVYSFLVDQELSIKEYLYNSIYLYILHPIHGSFLIAQIGFITFIIWMIFPPILLFILPGYIAFSVTRSFQRSIQLEHEKRIAS